MHILHQIHPVADFYVCLSSRSSTTQKTTSSGSCLRSQQLWLGWTTLCWLIQHVFLGDGPIHCQQAVEENARLRDKIVSSFCILEILLFKHGIPTSTGNTLLTTLKRSYMAIVKRSDTFWHKLCFCMCIQTRLEMLAAEPDAPPKTAQISPPNCLH